VYGEDQIIQYEMKVGPTIEELFFVKRGTHERVPIPSAVEEAKRAIREADILVVGPGSLTSYGPVALPLARQLREARGIRTLWTNIGAYSDVSVAEETLGDEEKRRLQRVPLEKLIGNFVAMLQRAEGNSHRAKDYLDYIVINGHDASDPKRLPFDTEKLKALGVEILIAPLEAPAQPYHHDAKAFTAAVLKLSQIHKAGYRIQEGRLVQQEAVADGGLFQGLFQRFHFQETVPVLGERLKQQQLQLQELGSGI